jgi:hypothetical protein
VKSEQYFAGEITVILADGSRVRAKVTADEIYVGGKEVYRISFEQGAEARTVESGVDFFEALKLLRQELEKLAHCCIALVRARMCTPLECRDRWGQPFWLTRRASAPKL